MESRQFFKCFFFGLFTHPAQPLDALSQRFLQILDQRYHTLLSRSREILLYIHLSDSLAQ